MKTVNSNYGHCLSNQSQIISQSKDYSSPPKSFKSRNIRTYSNQISFSKGRLNSNKKDNVNFLNKFHLNTLRKSIHENTVYKNYFELCNKTNYSNNDNKTRTTTFLSDKKQTTICFFPNKNTNFLQKQSSIKLDINQLKKNFDSINKFKQRNQESLLTFYKVNYAIRKEKLIYNYVFI